MSEGYEGLKTAKVIQTLGLGNAVGMNGALYTSEIADAVADFQAQHGLNATGTVDLTTWLAMGLSEDDWYTLGAYVSPLRIDNTSSRTACIEAMISRAYDYLGDGLSSAHPVHRVLASTVAVSLCRPFMPPVSI